MRVGSLFSGIGGVPLAARLVGWSTRFAAEIDPYCSGLLARHFPEAENLGDVTTLDGRRWRGQIDLLAGGFPCQDISYAGRGAGIAEGTRSGLWSEFRRIIEEAEPQYVLVENVSALRSRGLGRVLADLAALGYDAEWHCIPAEYIGAPHQRDRIWIVAYPDPDGARLEGWLGSRLRECSGQWLTRALGSPSPARNHTERARWLPEPDLPRVANGIPDRVDRIRGLGNSCVPLIPYLIFKAIDHYRRAYPWAV